MNTSLKFIGRIALAVAICLLVGALSGIATQSSVGTWYTTLNKPAFNPPNWVFAPVWTTLYFLMGVAAGLVWTREAGRGLKRKALLLFGLQLLLNACWSLVFFGLRDPLAALVILVALLVLIVLTLLEFRKIIPAAAYLLVPYLLWVAFAGILNFEIVRLN